MRASLSATARRRASGSDRARETRTPDLLVYKQPGLVRRQPPAEQHGDGGVRVDGTGAPARHLDETRAGVHHVYTARTRHQI